MRTDHDYRLLFADADYASARAFREDADELLRIHTRLIELYIEVEGVPPQQAIDDFFVSRFQAAQLTRICLRHAARRLDTSLRLRGIESDWESQVIQFDIDRPVVLAA